MAQHSSEAVTGDYAAFIGIDWADQQHAVCILTDSTASRQTLVQTPEAIAAWVAELQQQFGERPVAVALEQKRGALVQQLTETLKQSSSLALEIAGALTTLKVLALLQHWPTHGALRRANPETLRRFFREHGMRDPQRLDELVQRIRTATPLTRDPAAFWTATLVKQICMLHDAIGDVEKEIARLFRAHEDAALFEGTSDGSLPQ